MEPWEQTKEAQLAVIQLGIVVLLAAVNLLGEEHRMQVRPVIDDLTHDARLIHRSGIDTSAYVDAVLRADDFDTLRGSFLDAEHSTVLSSNPWLDEPDRD